MSARHPAGSFPAAPDSPFWSQDMLGPDYQYHTIELGDDPDGETDVCATVIRHLPADTEPGQYDSRPALLWVHGMTDYFFHTESAEYLHRAGYAVYALDMRKCGRSHRPGQRWHHTTDLRHYFPDLDAALDLITRTHPSLTPVAHSTGGLIVALWLSHLRETDPRRHSRISALILNSPWLDLMYPRALVRLSTPVIQYLGSRLPLLTLPNDGLGPYGKSIHRDYHGEWNFNTEYKPVAGHLKTFGWLRAIISGHREVHRDRVNVGVDVLTLCSERSWFAREYSPATDSADAVLDVRQIQKWAPHLSRPASRVKVVPITGARHDVFLSTAAVRHRVLDLMKDWLDSTVGAPGSDSGAVSTQWNRS